MFKFKFKFIKTTKGLNPLTCCWTND